MTRNIITEKGAINEVISDEPIMTKYYGINGNSYKPKKITELNINRILNKYCKEGLAIISANKTNIKDKTEKDRNETNIINTLSLIKDIKRSNFHYIPVYSGYRGTDGMIVYYEPSFIVTAFDRKKVKQKIDKLFNFAIEMCDKYDQNSILFGVPDEAPNYYDKSGNKINTSSSNNTITNNLTQAYFMSLIKTQIINNEDPERSEQFTYDIQYEGKTYEFFINPGPATYGERVARVLGGEFIYLV